MGRGMMGGQGVRQSQGRGQTAGFDAVCRGGAGDAWRKHGVRYRGRGWRVEDACKRHHVATRDTTTSRIFPFLPHFLWLFFGFPA